MNTVYISNWRLVPLNPLHLSSLPQTPLPSGSQPFILCIYETVFLWSSAAAKLVQSCPTLWDPMDCSPPGSPVPGIPQARTLEWGAIAFSIAWKWKVKGKSLSCVWLCENPWNSAYQAPPSMGFSRQEYWSGVPSPSLSYGVHASSFLFPHFLSGSWEPFGSG